MALSFGTSGLRGLVTDMTDRECAHWTRAFVRWLRESGTTGPVCLAGDLRSSTPRIMRAVAFGMAAEGAQVDFCGLVPTPALALHAMERQRGGVMVTGSHIPDDRNGIKFYLPSGEILKQDEQAIAAVAARLQQEPPGAFAASFDAGGLLLPGLAPELGAPRADAARAYVERPLRFFGPRALAGMRIAVWEHSSVSRDLLRSILEGLGAHVSAHGRLDRFTPVDTEAVRNPEELAGMVRGNDALVSTDGDGDRPLVVDHEGRLVRGDALGMLAARRLGVQSLSIPVSCTTAVERTGWFAEVRRTRIGSPWVIASMEEALKAGARDVAGFEANGGFLTGSALGAREGAQLPALPTRDAVLPAVAALLLARESGSTLAALVRSLPPRANVSGLLREVPFEKGRAAMQALRDGGTAFVHDRFGAAFGPVQSLDFTDGARIVFAGGDIVHFRPSGNAPEFRCYTEADTEERAQAINDRAFAILRATLLA